jgi:hypothetical protein
MVNLGPCNFDNGLVDAALKLVVLRHAGMQAPSTMNAVLPSVDLGVGAYLELLDRA